MATGTSDRDSSVVSQDLYAQWGPLQDLYAQWGPGITLHAQWQGPSWALYAQWEFVGDFAFVIFDANGGVVNPYSDAVYDGKPGDVISAFPTPSRPGELFAGWFTEPDGGTKVTPPFTVPVAASTTLFAHWGGVLVTVEFFPKTVDDGGVQRDIVLDETVQGQSASGVSVMRDFYLSPEEIPDDSITVTLLPRPATGSLSANPPAVTAYVVAQYPGVGTETRIVPLDFNSPTTLSIDFGESEEGSNG